VCAWSATRQLFAAACTAILLFTPGAVRKTHEVPMNPQQNAAVSSPQRPASEDQMPRTTIERFNEAFNAHDTDALAALMTGDTVFEDTSPAPDGRRIEGKSAVVDYWRAWFARNFDAQFDAEEMIVSGNRAVVRWVYRKMRNGQPWHLRGVDVFTVRDGKVAAKLAYVKG
jgi:ketosteroid isomerase-like protein